MRIIAAIYLTIIIVDFGLWANNGHDYQFSPSAYALLTWSLYVCMVLALLGFVIGKRLFPRRVWQIVFVVYLVTRLVELANSGFTITSGDIVADLNKLANYLWLVLPGGLAMWYLGFGALEHSASIRQRLMRRLTEQEQESDEETLTRIR